MRWFGFGFNAFGQIVAEEKLKKGASSDDVREVKVASPTELASCCSESHKISASWSRRASLHLDGVGCVCLAGFGAERCAFVNQIRGCTDACVAESRLILAFPDRIESWDLQGEEKTPPRISERKPGRLGPPLNLPLVPGGYFAAKPPFHRLLAPQLAAKRLSLSAEHAVLLTAAGAVYTWGIGSHGQLGHGGLTSEEEPRVVEALWGMPMSCVATGGWHSACISDGGDLYVWGWNESGQLGLPSRGLRKAPRQQYRQQAGETPRGEDHDEVFLSIQAFPALLDVAPSCEIRTVGCGSRHTAAVTTTGHLYTWGWGEYGQLGNRTLTSTDEPQRVAFFQQQQLRVVDVVCGAWNTFAAVVKEEVT
ncbi:RCC1 domain-containing protein 1-like [Brachionichthys hirsutus]|uniref:RCC1 domain-containing protein 1-like n=1 Tax=Brachionichthys hirsutus TaxID=412623 RepID=UPI003604835C